MRVSSGGVFVFCSLIVSASILLVPIVQQEYDFSSCLRRAEELRKLNGEVDGGLGISVDERVKMGYGQLIKEVEAGRVSIVTLTSYNDKSILLADLKSGDRSVVDVGGLGSSLVSELMKRGVIVRAEPSVEVREQRGRESIRRQCLR
jgi:hypothetical protein